LLSFNVALSGCTQHPNLADNEKGKQEVTNIFQISDGGGFALGNMPGNSTTFLHRNKSKPIALAYKNVHPAVQ